MSVRQIELIFLMVVIAFILFSVLFIRKGISVGFKPVEDTKKEFCKLMRNMIVIFYSISLFFLLVVKVLENLVRSIDLSIDIFNLLTTISISGAILAGSGSFVCVWLWCRLRCKKTWPWLWGFIFGAFSFFANIYLVYKVVQNSHDRDLNKA